MTTMAKPSNRPHTMSEIRNEKKRKRDEIVDKIRVYNISRIQPVQIQLYGNNSKLVMFQQCIQLGPGKHVDVPRARVIQDQIDNLKRRGLIRVAKMNGNNNALKIADRINQEKLLNIKQHQVAKTDNSNSNKQHKYEDAEEKITGNKKNKKTK